MARPRSSSARPLTRSFYDPHAADKYLPTLLTELLESGDPAIPAITKRVLAAKMADRDVTDPEVLDACIAAGRMDHLVSRLTPDAGGAA